MCPLFREVPLYNLQLDKKVPLSIVPPPPQLEVALLPTALLYRFPGNSPVIPPRIPSATGHSLHMQFFPHLKTSYYTLDPLISH